MLKDDENVSYHKNPVEENEEKGVEEEKIGNFRKLVNVPKKVPKKVGWKRLRGLYKEDDAFKEKFEKLLINVRKKRKPTAFQSLLNNLTMNKKAKKEQQARIKSDSSETDDDIQQTELSEQVSSKQQDSQVQGRLCGNVGLHLLAELPLLLGHRFLHLLLPRLQLR